MLKDYLYAIRDGLYELHTRGAVRSEGESILASLRTSADQAIQAAEEVPQAQPAQSLPDVVTTALAGIAADVAQVKAMLDELTGEPVQAAPATGAEG